MGIKTNKTTNTSCLNCQYVGSFPVSGGERKLTSSERNEYVIEKLKSCKKKLITGMAICLEVSPSGVRVLTEDEKTVKMAHPLRRISYATAETSNKLFAYVSHQPDAEMEIVCHTFLTRKKDHAEGLSAILGKLFKQTFAYTLKRRDKLEEVAQKRGANRRWAKHQVAEGHDASHAKTNERRRPNKVQNVTVPQRRGSANYSQTSEPSFPKNETPSPTPTTLQNEGPPPLPKRNSACMNIGLDVLQNQSPPVKQVGPDQTATFMTNEPSSPKGPSYPIQTNPANILPKRMSKRSISETNMLENLPRPVHTMDAAPEEGKPPLHRRLSEPISPLSGRPKRPSSPFTEEVAPTWLATNAQTKSLQMAASALLAEAGDNPPPLPRRRWGTGDQEHDTMTSPVEEEVFHYGDDDGPGRRASVDQPKTSLTLEDEDWYMPSVTRETVTEMLETSDIGTFFVRDSQSQAGCYALTMKVLKGANNPTGFANYLIVPVEDGFQLQGFDKVFRDISTLISHHVSEEDGLPCCLLLAGSNPLFHDANGYLVEFMDEEDETYSNLSNCRSMFRELKMNGSVPW